MTRRTWSVSPRSCMTTSAPAARNSSTECLPVATRKRSRTDVDGAADVERGVADHDRVGRGECRPAARAHRSERLRHQHVSMRRIVAEGAARKVSPEIEVFELEARAGFVVAGEEREKDVVQRSERVEQRRGRRASRPLRASPGFSSSMAR